ncbi:hypothetical protein HYN46_04365 [Aquirhabdus parva]|uniref:Uncharacterized protein n=1 Tax=Aquirhabdus parva TaxID=2283318 RepID=A0A345P4E5_9GAMM|nr:hypothetical protein HYN46_04365 [Aquirhabdus parva]
MLQCNLFLWVSDFQPGVHRFFIFLPQFKTKEHNWSAGYSTVLPINFILNYRPEVIKMINELQ